MPTSNVFLMKIKTFLLLFQLSLFSLSACGNSSDYPTIDAESEIILTPDVLSFSSVGGDASIEVSAPSEWDATASHSWIKVSKSGTLSANGEIKLIIDGNDSREPRSGSVLVQSKSKRAEVIISQEGKDIPTGQITEPEGYSLVWCDEFDGTELNRNDWSYEVQGPGWVNNELQTYVNTAYGGMSVTEVSDGTLKIKCFKAKDEKICSARIYARVSSGWKYGIFEASIKLPKGKGTWPAFWMMPVNNDWSKTPWPKCGEIDIMEEVGYNPNYTSSSIHCESYNHVNGTQKTAERFTNGAQDDFHIYRLEWTEDYIRTYVDGNLLLSFSNDGKGNISTWPFNRAFYPILNLAWGGSWGGAMGVDENCLPAIMEIDYVRVFQKK